MAIVAGDWTITRSNGNIRYTGHDHTGVSPSYATVIEFHRWLQSLADDAVAIPGDLDQLDITNTNPSTRSTDNIITLINGYNIDDTAAEHLYDGSIIQSGGDTVYDGIVNFGNPGVMIQIIQNGAIITDDWWNYSEGGTHTGSANAATLTDSSKTWTTSEWIGYWILNTTDGSRGLITANGTSTITAVLKGGTDNDWDSADAYIIAKGLNQSTAQGISHRFMLKVKTGGVSIDGQRLIGITRSFGNTFSEFSINGTSNGNNVLALSDSTDLNNSTSATTVKTWTSITNASAGYNGIDVNADLTSEYYYSKWQKDIYTINQFYERMKYLTCDGSAETLYGLTGELFRGITHEIDITGAAGTWTEGQAVTWATASCSGQLLAINPGKTKIWIQLLKGTSPSSTTLTAAAGGTATSSTVTTRTIANPFVGASTGSALIGAYGIGLLAADLSKNDKVFDLTNTQYSPPNMVKNRVSGLVNNEDYVLVAPWNGTSYDTNGDPAIQKDQLSLATTLNTDNITSVVVVEVIPTDTPTTGYIRVKDDDGYERRLHYSSWNGGTKTFTIDTTDGNEDFGAGGADATSGNDVYIAYLDQLATATYHEYQGVYDTLRNLVVLVRDGKATPIKQYINKWAFASSDGEIAAIRTTDT